MSKVVDPLGVGAASCVGRITHRRHIRIRTLTEPFRFCWHIVMISMRGIQR